MLGDAAANGAGAERCRGDAAAGGSRGGAMLRDTAAGRNWGKAMLGDAAADGAGAERCRGDAAAGGSRGGGWETQRLDGTGRSDAAGAEAWGFYVCKPLCQAEQRFFAAYGQILRRRNIESTMIRHSLCSCI